MTSKIVTKKVDELIPYDNNPRHNALGVDPVAESIKKFKFRNPILIDKDNVIIAGHTRLLASKKLGLKEVPCIVIDDLTPEEVKAYRIADNKTGEFSSWDNEKLRLELMEISNIDLSTMDMDLSSLHGLGFSKEQVQNIVSGPSVKETKPVQEFPEYDEDITTEHKCPKCGYEW